MYNKLIETFIQVADSGSFLKASEKLYISTVSVMKQINALEDSIGVMLLIRTNQGVVLTSAGSSIYEDAKKMMKMSAAAIQRAKEIAETEKHVIRIGSSNLRPHDIMLDRWAEIDNGLLPLQIEIVPYSDDYIDLNSALNLIGKEYDCLVSPCDPELWKDKYSVLILKTEPYCLALSRKHHLAQKKILTWEDLCGETIMLLSEGLSSEIDNMRKEIKNAHRGITVIDVPRSYTTSVFNECVQMNYLLGVPSIWAKVHPSLVVIPVDWQYKTYYGIVYEKEPSEKMQTFISSFHTSILTR